MRLSIYYIISIAFLGHFSFDVYAQNLEITQFSPYFHQNVGENQSNISITFNAAIDTNQLKRNIILFSEFSASKRYSYKYNKVRVGYI